MGKTTAKSPLLIRKFADDGAVVGGFQKIYEQLSKDDQLLFDRLRPEAWVDYGFYFRLLEAGALAAGLAPERFAEDFGIFQAEHDTRLLHRTALRLGGPGIMIMEADQIWRRYHDTGHLKVFGVLPTAAMARVEGLEGGGPLLCSVLRGFLATGLQLTGVKMVRVVHDKCRFRGDDSCEYSGTWTK